jgi:trans-aconitate methyltransferase
MTDAWNEANNYEHYVGRWSRRVAPQFLAWLNPETNRSWIDVGCGTGALSQAILTACAPHRLLAVDRSADYVASVSNHSSDAMLRVAADASALPITNTSFDLAVSGLVLNFLPDPARMIREMMRVLRTHGQLALYVWDYAGRMDLMRYFWDAVVELNPQAAHLDEAQRFPVCRPDALRDLLASQGLENVEVRAIDVDTTFRDFADYWTPFLGGQGPAPGYVASLGEAERTELRALIRSRLAPAPDGSISMIARAWAARGKCVQVNC